MNRFLKSLCLPSLLVALAACSTPSSHPDQALPAQPAPVEIPDTAPLVVPDLGALRDTPARALAGKFRRANWNELPGWSNDDLSQFWPLFVRNCRGLMRQTSGNLAAPARATPRVWQPVCAAAASLEGAPMDAAAVRRFLQAHLQPWQLNGADHRPAANTVTGYYEPLVRGSRRQGGVYQWPLYAVPEDLLTIDLGAVYPELAGKRVRGKLVGKRVVPYDTRAAIEAGDTRPPVIVWVNDPVDNFFLQVQGSGRVLLTEGPDAGTTIRVAYADHNGRPYVSIGRWLIDRGELRANEASMQNIRAWAKRNPTRVREMLNANPAMVFFREEVVTDPELGPKGAYGIALAAKRSIAVDPSFVPLGAPVYLSTTWPSSDRPLQGLVFAQDTGAAIKGAARADLYWGFGDEAGAQAGRMKQRGQMWVLWPKQAGEPTAR